MKTWTLIALVLLIIIQFAVPYHMILDRENTLTNGYPVRFRIQPVDPADPFQGRYVRLAYADNYVLCPEEDARALAYNDAVFVSVEIDSGGFATPVAWSRDRPGEGIFFKGRCKGSYRPRNPETKKREYAGLRFDYPFDRFYMEESKAPRAEKMAREAARTTDCWVNVRILNGKAVVEDVFIEGKSLRELAAVEED